MPWQDSTEEADRTAEKVSKAFRVVRDVPSRPTARAEKVAASRSTPALKAQISDSEGATGQVVVACTEFL